MPIVVKTTTEHLKTYIKLKSLIQQHLEYFIKNTLKNKYIPAMHSILAPNLYTELRLQSLTPNITYS